MASGIKVSSDVVTAFEDLKTHHKYKCVTFRVSDDETQIIVETKVQDMTWDEFQASLPGDQPRWAVYDFDYKNKEGHDRSKVIMVKWCPDGGVKVKAKMIHSSSSDALIKKCKGITKPIQASDRGDLNFDEVRDHILLTSQ
ncbi:uncharacterized protein [Branchiostoma lanceolatum]|uniref:uncharacterized protein isoform X1 n=1 Tax=Branchiostoma lanceolatum TaxID=7740 RepID=UPI0034558F70